MPSKLLQAAIQNHQKPGTLSWIDKLPPKVQRELNETRAEFWEQGAPCQKRALFKEAAKAYGLVCSEQAFQDWMLKGRPNV